MPLPARATVVLETGELATEIRPGVRVTRATYGVFQVRVHLHLSRKQIEVKTIKTLANDEKVLCSTLSKRRIRAHIRQERIV